MPELPGSEDFAQVAPGLIVLTAGDLLSMTDKRFTVNDQSPIAGI